VITSLVGHFSKMANVMVIHPQQSVEVLYRQPVQKSDLFADDPTLATFSPYSEVASLARILSGLRSGAGGQSGDDQERQLQRAVEAPRRVWFWSFVDTDSFICPLEIFHTAEKSLSCYRFAEARCLLSRETCSMTLSVERR
jgi:hypothetical protein